MLPSVMECNLSVSMLKAWPPLGEVSICRAFLMAAETSDSLDFCKKINNFTIYS